MAFGIRAFPEAIRELDGSVLTVNYQALGVPFTGSVRLVSFNNHTGAEVYFSLDGVTDHFRLPTNSFVLLDVSTNRVRDDGLFFAEGTQLYVKYVSSTSLTGAVWASTIVAQGGK